MGSTLVSKRRNVRERKVWDQGRKWEESIATPAAQRDHLPCNKAASTTESKLHLSCTCRRWGEGPFLQPQRARALPLLTRTLLTFLSLMLPLYH